MANIILAWETATYCMIYTFFATKLYPLFPEPTLKEIYMKTLAQTKGEWEKMSDYISAQ